MKKVLISLLAILSSTTALASQPATPAGSAPAAAAQSAAPLPDADPALWVVRDEDTTIYLFGTFHLLDGRTDWFNDEVRQAFDRSQELVFEIALPDDPAQMQQQMQPLIARYAVDQQRRRLSQRLTPEQNRAFNEAVASLGAPAGAFDVFEPWFASMTLTMVMSQRLGLTPENGAETVIKRAAAGRNMTMGAVETLEGQIRMFDEMPEELQLAMLREMLDDLSAAERILPRMLAVWNAGDAEGMDRIINEGMTENPGLRRILLGARNERWAQWIDDRLDRPGTVFMAVGAGHLVGSDSVQSFLARRNINSQRVPNAN